MRIKDDLQLRRVGQENVLISSSSKNVNVSRLITLNETACYLYSTMRGRDFEIEDAVRAICEHYDVEASVAEADVRELLDTFRKAGVLI